MYNIYIILLFIFIAIIGNVFFNNEENNEMKSEIEIDNTYLPPGYLIGFIWVVIFGLLGFIYMKVDQKKNKDYISRFSIMFFVALCFMYGSLIEGKSSRFIKNYNYIAFIALCCLTYILSNSVMEYKLYLLPIFLWVGYVSLLTLLDDLKVINLYIN